MRTDSPRASPSGITVVIPCFNARRYIAATLDSVLAQQDAQLEIIVVDDGSADGSADFVEHAYPQVCLIRQSNQGVAVARNRGVQEARHAWIAFLDADDIWLPGKLSAQRALLQQQPLARLCYAGWDTWASQEPIPPQQLLEAVRREPAATDHPCGPSGWIYPDLLQGCCVWTSTVLAERRLLLELGGFEPGVPVGEDYDLWLRASRVTPIVRVQQPLALYRLHPQSTTRALPKRNYKAEVIERALARWGLEGPDGRRAPGGAIQRTLARSWADFAGAQLMAGQLDLARHSARLSLQHWPWQRLAWWVGIKSLLSRIGGGKA